MQTTSIPKEQNEHNHIVINEYVVQFKKLRKEL
jgi:hypothetical protein